MINIILIVFIIGYLFITLEHKFDLNKSASALLTAFICWSLYALLSPDIEHVIEHLNGHLHGIAEIVFFLLGAMTIVEMIAVHNGFELLTEKITTKNKRTLLWIICIITFFLSAILDNLTTAIVMVSLLQKLLSDRQDRLIFSGLVVIAANAGGAWSPMGDVTTTMLWIGNQVTASHLLLTTFLPSIVCLL
ncbi:MAG TPA: sodium:proton antiporter NhaD, partial [Chitinophagales bacterium]|nr:sodium:proton antiporter NhaD [Chitinophagales bacterium]